MRYRPSHRKTSVFLTLILILLAYSCYTLLRPLPVPTISLKTLASTPTQVVTLPWPAYGQAAVGAGNYGVLATHGDQKSFPIASVAKVLTALAVLHEKPLKLGEQGPIITLTAQDAQYYQNYVAADGSVVPVTAGEQITEYQALQAMLLPSANNIAQSLATWAFGSEAAYTNYANTYALQLGMSSTHIADASGFSPSTTSTATDLVRLGLAALNNAVVSDIVNQSTAVVPGGGTVHNVNVLLGHNTVIGIKTGNTDQAGGCFLSASTTVIGGKTIKIVTAVEGAPDLGAALRDSVPLIAAVPTQFDIYTLAAPGQQFGISKSAWGTTTSIATQQAVSVIRWRSQMEIPHINMRHLSGNGYKGETVGTLSLNSNGNTYQVPLITQSSLGTPSYSWRLTHPL